MKSVKGGFKMIYFSYIVLALITVLATIKAAGYIDRLDKKTQLSGALIGGLLLAFVTSLPELITSLSATFILDEPALAFGNVLGSNFFNMFILAAVDLVFIKHYFFNHTKTGMKLNVVVFLMYLSFAFPLLYFLWQDQSLLALPFSFATLAITLLYILNLKDVLDTPDLEKELSGDMPVKTILIRFGLTAIVVVGASYGITFFTNQIALELNLNASFAGALFLGAATSLPELTAIIALVKLRSYDIAFGNIIGSSIFNFMILGLVDFLSFRENLFTRVMRDPELFKNITYLLLFGALNTIIIHVALTRKKTTTPWLYAIPSVVVVVTYLIYLTL